MGDLFKVGSTCMTRSDGDLEAWLCFRFENRVAGLQPSTCCSIASTELVDVRDLKSSLEGIPWPLDVDSLKGIALGSFL